MPPAGAVGLPPVIAVPDVRLSRLRSRVLPPAGKLVGLPCSPGPPGATGASSWDDITDKPVVIAAGATADAARTAIGFTLAGAVLSVDGTPVSGGGGGPSAVLVHDPVSGWPARPVAGEPVIFLGGTRPDDTPGSPVKGDRWFDAGRSLPLVYAMVFASGVPSLVVVSGDGTWTTIIDQAPFWYGGQVGADGALTLMAADAGGVSSVVRIDGDGTQTVIRDLGVGLGPLALAADGTAYALDVNASPPDVVRIDPDDTTTVILPATPAYCGWLTPDGLVLNIVDTETGLCTLTLVDLTTNTTTTIATGLGPFAAPGDGVTALAYCLGAGQLQRVNLDGSVDDLAEVSTSMAAGMGRDGNLYCGNDSGDLVRVDADGTTHVVAAGLAAAVVFGYGKGY